jgi:hypothetical protein
MFRFLRSPWVAECAAAALVFITAAVVGRQAAQGLTTQGWISAGVAIIGSITVAVMVHCWPPKRKPDPKMKAFQRPERD